jgi:hypothetical protein
MMVFLLFLLFLLFGLSDRAIEHPATEHTAQDSCSEVLKRPASRDSAISYLLS